MKELKDLQSFDRVSEELIRLALGTKDIPYELRSSFDEALLRDWPPEAAMEYAACKYFYDKELQVKQP